MFRIATAWAKWSLNQWVAFLQIIFGQIPSIDFFFLDFSVGMMKRISVLSIYIYKFGTILKRGGGVICEDWPGTNKFSLPYGVNTTIACHWSALPNLRWLCLFHEFQSTFFTCSCLCLDWQYLSYIFIYLRVRKSYLSLHSYNKFINKIQRFWHLMRSESHVVNYRITYIHHVFNFCRTLADKWLTPWMLCEPYFWYKLNSTLNIKWKYLCSLLTNISSCLRCLLTCNQIFKCWISLR